MTLALFQVSIRQAASCRLPAALKKAEAGVARASVGCASPLTPQAYRHVDDERGRRRRAVAMPTDG